MANALAQFLDPAGGNGRRILLVLVGLGAMAAVWGFSRWGMAPTWVPVVSGLPLNQVGEATGRLDESGIAYRLERSGSLITVPDADVARARVVLASEGLTGDASSPGFELFDQPSWGMTDFTQRVNYRRALEGELERTISAMRDVEEAQVHLALRESSFLRSEGGTGAASVVLRLRSGGRADGDVVEGVQSLVSSSVEGIAREDVTVLDDRGRLLSDADDDSGLGMTTAQLRVQRQIEEYLERKAESVVQQMVGADQATVRVAAELNFDRLDRTIQAVDPDQQFLVSEDRAEITPGTEDQGAGSVTTNTVFESTRSVETLSRGGARVERLTVAVVLPDRRIEAGDGTVTYEARTPAELQRVESLVRNAVGVSPERGDAVSVVSAPVEALAMPEMAEEGTDVVALAMAAQRPVVALAGLGMALFLTLRIVGALKAPVPTGGRRLAAAGAADALPRETPRAELGAGQPAAESAAPPAAESNRPALADPEMTARVLRSWMKEA
ncbi:MAG: flagellar basal-body MS-ring/collar protein FliF [Longimicrobiales bacterium]